MKVKSAAVEEFRGQVKEELKAEVVAEYQEELVKEAKQEWNDEQKAAIRKEVWDGYEMMLSRGIFTSP